MSFSVAPGTLESLEWSRLLARLARHCRTPQGAARIGNAGGHGLFEAERSGVERRLVETSEARALLDRDEVSILAGCVDVGPLLARAEKGGLLEPAELLDVRGTLKATLAAARFFGSRSERCPALSALAAPIATSPTLLARLTRCLDEGGELRDEASPALATARRDVSRLAGELEKRLERELRNPELAP
ncbi:hypothetical protein K2X89_02130, partial [Myxococcota bacterium]|nr:hypothetical protein [Myxococcota bacterium]